MHVPDCVATLCVLLQLNGISITLCQFHLISSTSVGTNSQLGGS